MSTINYGRGVFSSAQLLLHLIVYTFIPVQKLLKRVIRAHLFLQTRVNADVRNIRNEHTASWLNARKQKE